MNVLQKNEFKKAYKRLHDNQRSEVNVAIRKIISQPDIGEQKKGDLAMIWVYKFPVNNRLHLLAYSVDGDERLLWALGPHENFYRDLKK